MDPATLFTWANRLGLVGWVLLILLPRWRWTERVIQTAVLPLVFAGIYLVVIASSLGSAEGDFTTLAGVQQFFANPWVALGGWLHYLAFDLFTGSWEARDARRLGIPHLAVVPCLLLTLLLGPVGLLSYFILRWTTRRAFFMTT